MSKMHKQILKDLSWYFLDGDLLFISSSWKAQVYQALQISRDHYEHPYSDAFLVQIGKHRRIRNCLAQLSQSDFNLISAHYSDVSHYSLIYKLFGRLAGIISYLHPKMDLRKMSAAQKLKYEIDATAKLEAAIDRYQQVVIRIQTKEKLDKQKTLSELKELWRLEAGRETPDLTTLKEIDIQINRLEDK